MQPGRSPCFFLVRLHLAGQSRDMVVSPAHARAMMSMHDTSLMHIRAFLQGRSCYDVLPVSFRVVVLDTRLGVRAALDMMAQAGVVSAPLWSAENNAFAGMLTVSDVVHLIQFYVQRAAAHPDDPAAAAHAAAQVDEVTLGELRSIERALSVPPPATLAVHPLQSLFHACETLMRSHARRVPLIDHDTQSHAEAVISVLTQYRVLKFIAINCDTQGLHRSVRDLGIGTYVQSLPPADKEGVSGKDSGGAERRIGGDGGRTNNESDWDVQAPLKIARLDTRVHELIRVFSSGGIGGVPVVDAAGDVVDLYDAVDAVELLRTGLYTDLDLTVQQAIARRAPPSHPTQVGATEAQAARGAWIASVDEPLANVFALLRRRRVHRLILVDDAPLRAQTPQQLDQFLERGQQPIVPKGQGRLAGMLTLSDIVSYIVGHPPPPRYLPPDPAYPPSLSPHLNESSAFRLPRPLEASEPVHPPPPTSLTPD